MYELEYLNMTECLENGPKGENIKQQWNIAQYDDRVKFFDLD